MPSAGRTTCPGTRIQRPWWPVRCVPRTCHWATSASTGGTLIPLRMSAFFRHYKDLTGEEWRYAGEFFLPGPGGRPPPSQRVHELPDPSARTTSGDRCAGCCRNQYRRRSAWTPAAWVAKLADLLERIQIELAADVDCVRGATPASRERPQGFPGRPLRKDHQHADEAEPDQLPGQPERAAQVRIPHGYRRARTQYADSRVGSRLDLSRDLSSAIYEFAPGAELVAGGLPVDLRRRIPAARP